MAKTNINLSKNRVDLTEANKLMAQARQGVDTSIAAGIDEDAMQAVSNNLKSLDIGGAAERTRRQAPQADSLASDPNVYQRDLQTIQQVDPDVENLGISEQGDAGFGPFAEQRLQTPEEVESTQAASDLRKLDSESWAEAHAPEWSGQSKQIMIGSLDGFLELSNKVNKQAQRLAYNLKGQNAVEFSRKLSEGAGLDPQSVGEYLNGFIQNFAQLEERGISPALTDIHMAAMLNIGMENKWMSARTKEQADVLGTGQVAVGREEELGASSGTDAKVGRLIHKTIGIKSDAKMDAIGGAIARKLVIDAHPELFGTSRIATSKRDADGEQRTANVSVLNMKGHSVAISMKGLLDTMIPSSLKEVRTTPTVKKSDVSMPNKGDRAKDYGDYTFVNNTIDVLDNTPGRLSSETAKVLGILSDTVAFSGSEFLGIKHNRDGTERTVMIDEFTGEQKVYQGNNIKRQSAANEIMFAMDMNNTPIYWDHFLGTNNRFYARGVYFDGASVGNYQSTKIARAMLEGMPVTYDIRSPFSQDSLLIKAGIMKKFGKPYSGYSVAKAAQAFDRHVNGYKDAETGEVVSGWKQLMGNDSLTQANKEAIAEMAGSYEGFNSVSAMIEGVKLQAAFDAKQPMYLSGFYTEIDGIANGVGHNTLQGGGSDVIQRAVGLYSPSELKAVKEGKLDPEDVYVLTSEGALSALNSKGFSDERQAKVKAVLEAFTDMNGDTLINRAFGKKPMMIFGYGASSERIMEEVGGWVTTMIEENPRIAEVLDNNGVSQEDAVAVLGWGAVEAVENTFESVKLLNEFMQSVANEAIKAGIDPVFTMREGHSINLGEFITEIDPTQKPVGIKYSKGQRGDTDVNVTAYTKKSGIDSMANKAIRQAGVLPTHAQDGINIGTSFQKMAEYFASQGKVKQGAGGHQIFDGIFMTPKDAPKWAETLNNDFYDINKNWSFAEEFYKQMMAHKAFEASTSKKTKALLRNIRLKRANALNRVSKKDVRQFFWDY